MHDYIVLHSVCEETRAEHERSMALCCETRGYERRAGTSLGDKTIIMLNLCHTLKSVPSERMLTLTSTYIHITYRYTHTYCFLSHSHR